MSKASVLNLAWLVLLTFSLDAQEGCQWCGTIVAMHGATRRGKCREKKTVEEKKNKGFEGKSGELEGKKRDCTKR